MNATAPHSWVNGVIVTKAIVHPTKGKILVSYRSDECACGAKRTGRKVAINWKYTYEKDGQHYGNEREPPYTPIMEYQLDKECLLLTIDFMNMLSKIGETQDPLVLLHRMNKLLQPCGWEIAALESDGSLITGAFIIEYEQK